MNPKQGDKLICKRTADDKYFEDLRKDLGYKTLSSRDWDFPKKDKEFIVESVTNFGVYGIIQFKNVPRSFHSMTISNYPIWDWFYTPKEMLAISRKIKLEKLGKKI